MRHAAEAIDKTDRAGQKRQKDEIAAYLA